MSTPINVFIIYAREDTDIKQRLLRHLNPFTNAFNATIWHDGNIEAGQEWKPHIQSRLDITDLFILLVSIDFMNSEFINQVEFKYAIERHKAKKSIVIPVIINYCQWDIDITFKDFTFNLKELQVLPDEGRPIDDWKTPEQAFNNIAAGIRGTLSSIKLKREQEQQEKEKLELQLARNKIEEEKKQAILKEKAIDEQIKTERERVELENETKLKNYHTAEETRSEYENQTIEIIDEPSFFAVHKKKLITGGLSGVVVLIIFLLIKSSTSNKEKGDMSEGSPSTAATTSAIVDSSLSAKQDESVKESESPKILPDTREVKKTDKSKTGNQPQEGIKDEESAIFQKVEIEASFPGGDDEWRKYLAINLNANVPVENGAAVGVYTVVIQFIVDKEGYISDVSPLTKHGHGMEEEAIRVIKKGPLWVPAIVNGRHVKSYRKQPISFVLEEG